MFTFYPEYVIPPYKKFISKYFHHKQDELAKIHVYTFYICLNWVQSSMIYNLLKKIDKRDFEIFLYKKEKDVKGWSAMLITAQVAISKINLLIINIF
jgi:hypothetical protein